MIDFAALVAPFPPAAVSWRVGSTNQDKTKGMALAYIDARDVMERLDAVCGPAGWQRSYPHAGAKTVCRISIKVGDEWIGKEDGAGDSDVEAEKGALSDAFKRAAVSWGIGRYLYNMGSPWVAIEQKGTSYVIAPSEMRRLETLLAGGSAPAPARAAKPLDAALSAMQANATSRGALLKWRMDVADRIGRFPPSDQAEFTRIFNQTIASLEPAGATQ
jgi:hypothetical protein